MQSSTYRLMGLDVGDERVGIALSDPSHTYALPHSTVRRKETPRIVELVKAERVKRIVVGMPYELDGDLGPQAEKVKKFIRSLEAALKRGGVECPIETVDERLTTSAAEHFIVGTPLKNSSRRAALDQVAASLILESYLMRKGTTGDIAGEPESEREQ
jgi:putative Holliday junction resolvase